MQITSQLLVHKNGEITELRSPEVGLFTCALDAGALVGPGQTAGSILCVGQETSLTVPPGVHGRIANAKRDRVQAPVGYGDVLYELSPIDAAAGPLEDAASQLDSSGLVLRAEQAGRFYHRPSPDEPAYAEVGSELTTGQAIGLVEIMKTFGQVHYIAASGLPERARLVRFLADDGAEIKKGDALIEVEPA